MVNITEVLVALVLFAIVLAASMLLLSGLVPSFNEAVSNIACGTFKICLPASP